MASISSERGAALERGVDGVDLDALLGRARWTDSDRVGGLVLVKAWCLSEMAEGEVADLASGGREGSGLLWAFV